jgi:dolichyl-phosphate-mannose-protein mannosyltransferase
MTAKPDRAAATRRFEFEINRRWIVLGALLFAGLLVRFWAMRWPPFPYDMNTWIAWADRLRQLGPGNFYEEGYFADYTPGYLYVLWFIAEIKAAFFGSSGTGAYQVLLRLPATFCDLGIAVIIFLFVERAASRIVRRRRSTTVDTWPVVPAIVTALWLFNPAIIFNSAVWGQVDSTFTLAVLLALVFLISGRPEAAIISYALAVLIKPHALAVAPVIALALFLWFTPRQIARSIGLGLLVGIILLVPFFGLRFIPGFWDLLAGSRDQYAYTSLNAYNLWGIYGFWRDDRLAVVGPFTARGIGLALYMLGLGYGLGLLWTELRRGADRAFTLFLFSTYFVFLPVMVLTTMHERYLYPVLPFLLVFAGLCYLRWMAPHARNEIAPRFLVVPLVLFLAITVLHTMNLYQVYQFYLFFEEGGVPAEQSLYFPVADNARVWSVLMLYCFWVFVVLIPSWTGASVRTVAEPAAPDDGSRGPAPRPA